MVKVVEIFGVFGVYNVYYVFGVFVLSGVFWMEMYENEIVYFMFLENVMDFVDNAAFENCIRVVVVVVFN